MRRTRSLVALVVGAAALSMGTSADARKITAGHHKSWGMEGVSLEQYSTDSIECARAAAEIDLTGTAPADALVLASRMMDNSWNLGSYYAYFDAIRVGSPRVQWNRAATIMQNELEGCLTMRGYVKFELTDEQYERLQNLEHGSDERRAYLHSLASDPAVLAAQGITES